MKSRPEKSCLSCGSNNWWYREPSQWGKGEWLCGRCHPNPNKEVMMQENIELIDGKFVVKGREEIKAQEQKVVKPKQYSEEVVALKERVIQGNQKLFNAWLKIKEIAHGSEEWSKQMGRWHDAGSKLHLLCIELQSKGYNDCLYLNDDGKKTKACLGESNGWWCQVCPSSFCYWENELMDLRRD